jgi:predicted RNase H-like HicB family nuclease
MTKSKPSIGDILKEPYTRILVPDSESGTYGAEILEFPGCVSQGDTPAEAYANLEEAATSWLEATLEAGQSVPQPFAVAGYSGRFALRLPRGLHRQASQLAEMEGSSLNQFFVAAIAEKVGATNAANLYSVVYGGLNVGFSVSVIQGTGTPTYNVPLSPPIAHTHMAVLSTGSIFFPGFAAGRRVEAR